MEEQISIDLETHNRLKAMKGERTWIAFFNDITNNPERSSSVIIDDPSFKLEIKKIDLLTIRFLDLWFDEKKDELYNRKKDDWIKPAGTAESDKVLSGPVSPVLGDRPGGNIPRGKLTDTLPETGLICPPATGFKEIYGITPDWSFVDKGKKKSYRGLSLLAVQYAFDHVDEIFTSVQYQDKILEAYKSKKTVCPHSSLMSYSCNSLKQFIKDKKIVKLKSKQFKKLHIYPSTTELIDNTPGSMMSGIPPEDKPDSAHSQSGAVWKPEPDDKTESTWTTADEDMLRDNYDDVDKIVRLRLIKGKTREDIEQKIKELGLVKKQIEAILTDDEPPKKQPLKKKTEDLRELVKKREKERKKYGAG